MIRRARRGLDDFVLHEGGPFDLETSRFGDGERGGRDTSLLSAECVVDQSYRGTAVTIVISGYRLAVIYLLRKYLRD